ncbi:imidazolonepropionase [Naematelia encephala]|uniref:Imidazolonepropionase n=1 Tax=Naematelia encephala TaxID=71784 RepID=A0A1Y2AX05_9TREE|nr:imidazolonepropionase [Naematelia encephala]
MNRKAETTKQQLTISSMPDLKFRKPVPVNIELKNRNPGIDPQFVIFKEANILDSTGKEPYVGDVLIDGERFAQVGGEVDPAQYPEDNTLVVNAKGKTLMSGLCDSHTHLTWNDAPTLNGLCDLPNEEHMIHTVVSAKCYLDHGFTMCFGAASAKKRLDVACRDFIQAGKIPGPRYLANGPEISTTGGAIIPGITLFADGPDEMRKVVRDLMTIGVDNIKLSMTGDYVHPTMGSTETYFTQEEVDVAVEEAHRHGKRVAAHARAADSVVMCCKAGVDVIYHASYCDDEGMKLLEQQKDRIFVAPAINFPLLSTTSAAGYGLTPEMAKKRGLVHEVEAASKAMNAMYKKGIRVLPGGDYGFAWAPHGTYARDIDHFVRLFGYTPMDAILAATALGGEIMGHPEELGKVQPGYYADCILVDTPDVLADVRVLQDTTKIHGIFINGHKHKLSETPAPSYNPAEVTQKNGVKEPNESSNGHANGVNGAHKGTSDVANDSQARLEKEMP